MVSTVKIKFLSLHLLSIHVNLTDSQHRLIPPAFLIMGTLKSYLHLIKEIKLAYIVRPFKIQTSWAR